MALQMGLLSSSASFQYNTGTVPRSTAWPIPTCTSPYIAMSWCHPRTPNMESFLWEDEDGPITRPISSPMVGHDTLQGHIGSDSLQTADGPNVLGLDWEWSQSRSWRLALRLSLKPFGGTLPLGGSTGTPCQASPAPGPLLLPAPSQSTFSSSPSHWPRQHKGTTSKLEVTSGVYIQCHLFLFSYKVHFLDF